MSKEIKIIVSHDGHECEICSGSFEESYQIEYEGNLYGLSAYARCFDSDFTTLEQAYELFLIDQGYSIKREAI